MSHLFGPLFAGLGLSVFGLKHLFTADAISFLFSIVLISFITLTSKKIRSYKHPTKLQGIVEGLKYVHAHKGLRLLLLLTFINNIFI